jgi:two-component system, NarL family, nitrate/nitrite sensor histidine kinase NarX
VSLTATSGTASTADRPTERPSVRLGRRLSIALATFVLAMVVAGGVSLFLGLQIHKINAQIDDNFSHALAAGEIYDTFHRIISEVQHIQATGMFDRFDRLPGLRRALAERVRRFAGFHGKEHSRTLWAMEGPFLERLGRIEADLGILLDRVEKTFGSRVYLQPAEMVRLREVLDLGVANSEELHRFHQARVLDLTGQSQRLIQRIIWLYLVFLLIGLFSVGAAGLVLRRQVALPLVRLAGAARGIADGNLEGRVPVLQHDEIGQLSEAFNLMADRLQARERDVRSAQAALERKLRETEALNQIGSEMLAFKGQDAILQTIAEQAREILRVDAAAICLASEGSGAPTFAAKSGPVDAFLDETEAAARWAARVSGAAHSPGGSLLLRAAFCRSHLEIPLQRGRESVGFLCVGARVERSFDAEDRAAAFALAAQAAITVEHGRLDAQVRELAVSEERGRIARDLHDGLAQSVSLLHLKARQAQALFAAGEPSLAAATLTELADVSASAYDEVRQSIFGLRTMVSGGLGFLPTLAELLHEFSEQHNLPVKLETDGAEQLRLAPASEVQVIRIVQEVLTNIRKHAQARHIRVSATRRDGRLRLSVEDDGRGFDPAKAVGPNGLHFGLQGMRERAERLEGTLEIVTAPDKGTRVTVTLPVAREP